MGESSHDVVRKVKSALNIRKAGHAGTLDPFATGLMVVLLGQGTKLSSFIMPEEKTYVGTVRLGIETDTMDPTGEVTGENAVPDLDPEYIRMTAEGFIGEIEQTPPVYSAVKYNGVRAYKLARRGRYVVLNKRTVVISGLRIVSVELPDITFEVACSSGTYVRSLAVDLARSLGTVGHLVSLRRLSCGPFHVRDAISSQRVVVPENRAGLADKLISLKDALPRMREIVVGERIADKIRHGYQPALSHLAAELALNTREDTHLKIISGGRLVAIIKLNIRRRRDSHGRLKIERVFS